MSSEFHDVKARLLQAREMFERRNTCVSEALKREGCALIDLLVAAVETEAADRDARDAESAASIAAQRAADTAAYARKATEKLAATKRICAKESMLAVDAAERMGDVRGALRADLEKGT